LEARTLFDNSTGSTLEAEIVNRGTGYELAITVDRTDMSPLAQDVPIELTDANGDAIPGLPTSFTLRIAPGSGSVTGVVQLPAGVFDPSVVHENAIGINRVDARQETEIVEWVEPTTGPTTQPAFGPVGTLPPFFENRRDKSTWPRPGWADARWLGGEGQVINNSDHWIWVLITSSNGTNNHWYPLGPVETTPEDCDVDAYIPMNPREFPAPGGDFNVVGIPAGKVITVTDPLSPDGGLQHIGGGVLQPHGPKAGGHIDNYPPTHMPKDGNKWRPNGFVPADQPVYR